MEMNEYQKLSLNTDQRTEKESEISRIIPLLGLVGEIGSVAAEHKKRLRDGKSYSAFKEKFKEELGDVLWYVSTLASDMDISLEDIAAKNLDKLAERWTDIKLFDPTKLLDDEDLESERLPRELQIRFKLNSHGKAEMHLDGKIIGDALTDNAHVDDGYKFHDAFHLAYMAVLGWSPVMRKNLGIKRRSNPTKDEVEDGARARIIDEAIAAMVYEHAKDHKLFENIDIVDYQILRTIKTMVQNYEVKNLPTRLWEQAILGGYEVFRKLKERNGGTVVLNMRERSIKYLW